MTETACKDKIRQKTKFSETDNVLLRYGHLKFSKMVAGHPLGFDTTENGAVRSAVPENPTLEPNMKGIG